MNAITFDQHVNLKRDAKKLKKELDITHSEALEHLAKNAGFNNYHHLTKSVSDPRPHEGLNSSLDELYKNISLNTSDIWFVLDVKDAEKYDHASFPKRWGIKEDESKLNLITNDILKHFKDIPNDRDNPSQSFYWNHKVFTLKINNAKTLLDVCKYVREIFFWGPIYVFQGGVVYETIDEPKCLSHDIWTQTLT